jgi:hypothetical protein
VSRELLDDFSDLSGWSAIASGQAQLALRSERGERGAALCLDFDFRDGSGFVVARRELARALPASFALHFGLRGEAPPLRFELKLVDASGRNVWWIHRDGYVFPRAWERQRVRSRELEFAWGPAGGGAIRELGAIEIAIAAGSGGAAVAGGRGRLLIDALEFEDREPAHPPRATASSSAPGSGAELAIDGRDDTAWRSDATAREAWLALDFGSARELGGLIVEWEPGSAARRLALEVSDDARTWTTRYQASGVAGARSYLPLANSEPCQLRLLLREPAGTGGFGVRALRVQPFEFSRSPDAFFRAVAAHERRGCFPRYASGEQSYWTPVGIEGRSAPALVNEEGLVEVERGAFSLEPLLAVGGEVVTWADAEREALLLERDLPIPSLRWRWRDLALCTTACAVGPAERPALVVRYRIENAGTAPRALRFGCALRAFQVTPPWQAFRGFGGVAEIRTLAWRDRALWVNGARPVVPLQAPSAVLGIPFAAGPIANHLAEAPSSAATPAFELSDASGWASGALVFELELEAGASRELAVAVPLGAAGDSSLSADELRALRPADEVARARRAWRQRLGAVHFELPASAGAARDAVEALRTATAHVLIQRDGAALQPGPRRYTRAWIRDGALMGSALLRMHIADPMRDFLRWYSAYQRDDGFVPCCVDASGADWLVEHDSHGQWLFAIAEHFRFTRDEALARELWPGALRAIAYLEALRRERLTPETERGELRARRGLLPESASHEGYLAHPVHSYWDDFWALRGLADARWLAGELGAVEAAPRIERLRRELAESLYASISLTQRARGLATIPASVEWADFDPVATAAALVWNDAAKQLPAAALAATCDLYLEGLRKRVKGESQQANYTPYEIRMVAALVRLGRRADAHELLAFMLSDRRPRAWQQWPEIAWRDARSPGHLGDLPHSWIAAEYALAVLSLFAYERAEDGTLVLAAGIPEAWIAGGERIGVAAFPTYWGALTYHARHLSDAAIEFDVASAIAPPGGIELRPPLARGLQRVSGDLAGVVRQSAESVTLARGPARVVLHAARED